MPELNDLRKRLQSIRSTGQLAGAMRTAATAKYAKLNRLRGGFSLYAGECRAIRRETGGTALPRPEKAEEKTCLVVLCGNRGMCGGFNAELLRYLEKKLPQYEQHLLVISGSKKASIWLREHKREFEEILLPDTPTFEDVRPLADRLRQLYASGEVDRVLVMYQSYINTLVQKPAEIQLLPEESAQSDPSGTQRLVLPDLNAIRRNLADLCYEADLYELVLENACGAQAATIVSTRSACDNAKATIADLEIQINRRRQAEVTSSVIETSTGMAQQGD